MKQIVTRHASGNYRQVAEMAQRGQIHHRFSRSVSTELLIGPTQGADLLPAHKQDLDLKDAQCSS
jgi:hypothetical protein